MTRQAFAAFAGTMTSLPLHTFWLGRWRLEEGLGQYVAHRGRLCEVAGALLQVLESCPGSLGSNQGSY
jgi:hypothetical protein